MKLRKKYVFTGIMGLIVLALLVGSFTFFFPRVSQPERTSLRPGWRQIATYSGTGSKIIKGVDLVLPNLWGYAISCTGRGGLDVDVEGNGMHLKMGKHPCSLSVPSPSLPQSIEYDIKVLNMETLSITADATVSWHLEFVKGSSPNLHPGPGWIGIMGIGSVGGSAEGVLGNSAPTRSVWGLVGVCMSEGSVSAQFTPSSTEPMTFSVCDGVPRLLMMHYSSPTAVQDVKIAASKKNTLFSAYVVACANEQQCSNALSAA